MGTIVDGNALFREVQQTVATEFAELMGRTGVTPRVAIVQISADPAASLYTRRLQRTFTAAGPAVDLYELPEDTAAEDARALVARLSASHEVHAIQIQTPLPPHIPLADLADALDPAKDVDGIHPENAGRLAQGRPRMVPATPLAGMEILLRYGVQLSGARAVVVGRSTPVGRPMALLLVQHNATVTICHTRTKALGSVVQEADVVAVAAGRAGLVTADMIRVGAAVIDFGINFVDGKMVGDVEPAAADRAGVFTPVPGGTGPVTNAMLLRNALILFRDQVSGNADRPARRDS